MKLETFDHGTFLYKVHELLLITLQGELYNNTYKNIVMMEEPQGWAIDITHAYNNKFYLKGKSFSAIPSSVLIVDGIAEKLLLFK